MATLIEDLKLNKRHEELLKMRFKAQKYLTIEKVIMELSRTGVQEFISSSKGIGVQTFKKIYNSIYEFNKNLIPKSVQNDINLNLFNIRYIEEFTMDEKNFIKDMILFLETMNMEFPDKILEIRSIKEKVNIHHNRK